MDERTERIREMEARLDRLRDWLANPEGEMEEDVRALEEYYRSPLWRADFEADEAGELPADLKRGVLSEDGLYDALEAWGAPKGRYEVYQDKNEEFRFRLKAGNNEVIAVSEGLRTADGTYVGEGTQSGVTDVFGHKYLSGTGKALELAVKEKLGCKVRSVELNILQRCASHIASATDLTESVTVGSAAVKAAAEGLSGRMMNFQRQPGDEYVCTVGSEDVHKIANAVRTVPDEFINAEGNNITDAGVAHILPLIQGETRPEFENGLPVHFLFL